MDRLFKSKNKRKKSPSPPQLGIPTQIVDRPPGFPTDLGIGPKDEGSSRGSRIAFQDKEGEDQGLTAPKASTSRVAVHSTESAYDRMNMDTDDTQRKESELAEASRVAKRARRGTVLGGAATPIDVATEATEGFSSLKAALGAIPAVYANREGTATIGDIIENLLARIVGLETRFETSPGDVEELRRRSDLIGKFMGIEGQLRQFADRVQDDEQVSGLLEGLRKVIFDYQMVHQTAMYEQQCKQINPAEAAVLRDLCRAREAEYRHGDRNGCLKGTRGAVMSKIELWANDFEKPPVYWLNGLAGTGKTTIAQTIAERLFADGRLGASFFCSRNFEDRSNRKLIFPTLAAQLARRYTKFRPILVSLVQSDPEVAHESLYNQADKLVFRPLRESAISTVIIIDALDECKDEESASAILSVLGRFVSETPSVKFFLTGRPEPRVREGFRLYLPAKVTDVFILHDVERGFINSDIQWFFKHSFLEIAHRRGGLVGWPTKEQLDILCKQAAGLFVYAAATVKFIDNQNNNPRKRLDLLLQSPESSACEGKAKLKNMTLDSLYMSILQQAFGDDDPEDDPRVCSVLGAVVLTANPLSPSSIATLLGLDAEDVPPLLSSVNSLLILQEDPNLPVQPFHKSFPDFLTDPARCTNQRFHISPPDHHLKLLINCLTLMNQTLEKNMCNLPDAVANSDVSDLKERSEKYINPALRYACMFWHVHLICAHTMLAHASAITSTLHQFLEKKFLFWLEVLSVLGATRNAVDALQAIMDWSEVQESPVLNLINDCFHFVTKFFEVINTSAPHIYHSALALAPQESIVRRQYQSYAHPFVRLVYGAQMSWDQNIAAKRCPHEITQAVWSPCNKFVAIACYLFPAASRAYVLDSVTFQQLQTLEFPQDMSGVTPALIFSPDSCVLTCFQESHHRDNHDKELFVTSWDLQTGGTASVIRWRSSKQLTAVNCSITYSANGKLVGTLHRHFEEIGTFNISICDVASGVHMSSHLLNCGALHSSDIGTYGESFQFATVDITTITIWEVRFISGGTPIKVKTLPASNNSDPLLPIQMVRFLPSLCLLALALKNRVLVWDVQNSRCLLDRTYAIYYPYISFSSNGCFFACATSGDVYLWKESPTGYIHHKTLQLGPPPDETSLHPCLSWNGESIAVYSEHTIRLWQTNWSTTPLSGISTPAPESPEDFILDFSPDGMLAAVARRNENVVTVLNPKSGALQLTIKTGIWKVCGLGVIGNTVVVICDGEVIAWDIPAEGYVSHDWVGPNNSSWTIRLMGLPEILGKSEYNEVHSASISPNFCYIALAMYASPDDDEDSQYLCIYNTSTGECLGYEKTEGTIALFTPDGYNIWCTTGGYKGEMWSVGSGQSMLERLGCGVDVNYPPEGYPWASSCGYEVIDDQWVLDPDGEQLLMLPPPWQSYMVYRVWKGKFLALLHGGLPKPVILELEP